MKTATIFSIITALLVSAVAGEALEIFVDPVHGSDSNNGRGPQTAFKSLIKARDAIRSQKLNRGMREDLFVRLRGGIYRLDKTFWLDARDSGDNGHAVVWCAYKDEKPVISGGRRVTGWQPVTGKPYYRAPVPLKVVKRRKVMFPGHSEALNPRFYDIYGLASDSFAPYFAQLYVNGVRAELARSHTTVGGSRKIWWNDPATVQQRDGIYVKKSSIRPYTNPEDVRLLWVELFKTFDAPVADVIPALDSKDEAVLKMRQPQFDKGSSWKRIQPQTPFFVVNALEELDEPGEWYLDQKKHVVYYFPSRIDGDLNQAEVYAPRVDRLLLIGGSPMERVHDIRIEGIIFEYGNWNERKDNYLGISQAEIFKTYTDQIPGQLYLRYADRITIRGCRVAHMGSCGIDVHEACRNILIEGNVTFDTTGAGITVGKWFIDPRECPPETVCKNITVRDNVVRNTGRDYWQATGINVFAAQDCTVAHNDVSDTAYTAVHARIGDSPYIHPDIGRLNYYSNKVSRAFAGGKWGIGDGGHLYQHGRYPGSRIIGNYSLYASPNINMEYYPDNHSYKALWTSNISRWSKARCPFFVKGQVTVTGNFSDKKPCRGVKNHTLVKDGNWPPAAREIMRNAGLEPQWQHLLKTVYGHENLALHKPCQASSSNGAAMEDAKGNDGNPATFWHTRSGGDGQGWWQVDLGAPYVIRKVTILPRQDLYQAHARSNLEVQASNDPEFKKYTVLAEQNDVPWYNKTTSHASNLWEKFVSTETPFRYLRVKSTKGPGSLNFAEFGAYGYRPVSGN